MRQRDAEHTLQGTVPFRPESNSPSFRHLVHVCSYSALIRPPSQGGKGAVIMLILSCFREKSNREMKKLRFMQIFRRFNGAIHEICRNFLTFFLSGSR